MSQGVLGPRFGGRALLPGRFVAALARWGGIARRAAPAGSGKVASVAAKTISQTGS
jgi:hypothetical protein